MFFFFFPMNVNHPAWPVKAVSAVTDTAFTDLFLSEWLTEEDVRDPASVGSSASSFIGRAQIARRELTFTIFIHRIFC